MLWFCFKRSLQIDDKLQPPSVHWTEDKIRKYKEEATLIHAELKDATGYLAERLLDKIEMLDLDFWGAVSDQWGFIPLGSRKGCDVIVSFLFDTILIISRIVVA